MTVVGWVFFIALAASFVAGLRPLLAFCVFVIPFSATAVVAHPSLSPYPFAVLALVLKICFGVLAGREDIGKRGLATLPLAGLLLFLASIAISAAGVAWIAGVDWVESVGPLDRSSHVVKLGSIHLVTALWFGLGAFWSLALGLLAGDPGHRRVITRSFAASGLFCAIWGLYQVGCQYLHMPYLYGAFNNSELPVAKGYLFQFTVGDHAIPRLASVAMEPSFMAMHLSVVLALLVGHRQYGGRIFTARWDTAIVMACAVALGLTLSATGLIAMCVIALWLLYVNRRSYGRSMAIAVIIATPIALYLSLSHDVHQWLLARGGPSESTRERIHSVAAALPHFLRHPVLGIGWGSVTSHDMIVLCLSSGGALGLSALVFFLFMCVKWAGGPGGSAHSPVPLQFAMVVLIAQLLTSGFPYYLGLFWTMCGICMSPGVGQTEAAPEMQLYGRAEVNAGTI